MIEMIKYNQLNQIAYELLIVWTRLGWWGIFENDSVDSDCMGGIVESDLKENSDVIFLK